MSDQALYWKLQGKRSTKLYWAAREKIEQKNIEDPREFRHLWSKG